MISTRIGDFPCLLIKLRVPWLVALILLCVTQLGYTNQYSIESSFLGTNRIHGAALGSNAYPAMPAGAAGPQHLVEFSSSTFATYSKTGNLIQRIGHRDFWRTALAASGSTQSITFPSSTKVLFHDHTSRWYAVATDNRFTNDSNLLVAVTNGPDPTSTNWRAFSIDFDSAFSADFVASPYVGIDGEALYISGDVREPVTFGFANEMNLFGIPLSSLTASIPSIQGLRVQERIPANDTGLFFQPTLDMDNGTGAHVGASYFNNQSLKRTIIPDGWLENLADISEQEELDFASNQISNGDEFAAQPGSTDLLVGADFFRASVVSQNGSLWAVHVVDIGGRHGLRWYELSDDAGQFIIKQFGEITDPQLEFYYPSIAVNDFGDVAIGFSGSADQTPISAYLAVGNTVDGTTTFDDPVVTHAGFGAYTHPPNGEQPRWGEFSSTVVDAEDSFSFWTFQAFNQNNVWRIGITQVTVVPEPNVLVLVAMWTTLIGTRSRRKLMLEEPLTSQAAAALAKSPSPAPQTIPR